MRAPPPPCGCVGVRRARFHVPRRVPPRGARQNRLRVMFSAAGCRVFGFNITLGTCSARRFALPAARSPFPCAFRRARRAGRRFPFPLGQGCALSRRRARWLRSAPPPTPPRGLPASRGLPPPRRESGMLSRRASRRASHAFFISSRRSPLRCAAVVGAASRPAPVVRVLPPVGARQSAAFPAPCPSSLSGMFLRRVPPAACEALRAVFSAARSAPFRASPRFLPRFARRVVFMPPRHARERAGACVNAVKMC